MRIVASGDYKRRLDPTCQTIRAGSLRCLHHRGDLRASRFSPSGRPRRNPKTARLRRAVSRAHASRRRLCARQGAARHRADPRGRLLRADLHPRRACRSLCDLYRAEGIDLGRLEPATLEKGRKHDFAGKIVIGPPSAFADRWARRFADPVSCFASGWMRIRQRARQSGVELPLVISDHCDWDELCDTIRELAPKEVWVTHGREEALVRWCELAGHSGEAAASDGLRGGRRGMSDANADIHALFAAYGAGFDDADPDAVTALFAWPATIWQFGEGHVFEDADELSENVDALMDVFDEAGIVSTTPEVKEVRVAGSAAFAHVVWRQQRRRRRAVARIFLPVFSAQSRRRLAHRVYRQRGLARRRLARSRPCGEGQLSVPSITIRPCAPSDVTACVGIFDRAWHAGHPYAPRVIDEKLLAAETADETLFVADDERDEVIGFVSIYLPQSFVHHLYVDPARRAVAASAENCSAHAVAAAGGSATLKCQTRQCARASLLPPSRLGRGRGRHRRIRSLGRAAQPILRRHWTLSPLCGCVAVSLKELCRCPSKPGSPSPPPPKSCF